MARSTRHLSAVRLLWVVVARGVSKLLQFPVMRWRLCAMSIRALRLLLRVRSVFWSAKVALQRGRGRSGCQFAEHPQTMTGFFELYLAFLSVCLNLLSSFADEKPRASACKYPQETARLWLRFPDPPPG